MNQYRRFTAWQRCRELTCSVYRHTAGFPSDERFGLVSQLRRACVSATVNIAEGAARLGRVEFARFLGISLGSLAEVDALLDLSAELGSLGTEGKRELDGLRDRASRATFVLKRSLRR